MPAVRKKLGTLARVARERGARDLAALVGEKAGHWAAEARLLPRLARARARHGRPEFLLGYRGGIGDDLLVTAVLRELRRRGHDRVWLLSRHPALFARNPDVGVLLPWDLWNYAHERVIPKVGWRLVQPEYTVGVPGFDGNYPPVRHILSLMCRRAGVTGEVALRPYLTLTDDERAGGRRARRQVAIQSAGVGTVQHMRTKQWFPERFQRVVDLLRDRYDLVQVGSAGDPPLEGALDLRGQTSLRETAAVLSQSLAFVGNVGFLMHLARAVECRGVIVYGGRELPAQSGYGCNENLYTPVSCSPCWRWNSSVQDYACMRRIEPEHVARAVERAAARHGEPLEVDTDVIADADADVPDPNVVRRVALIPEPFGAASGRPGALTGS